MSDHRHAPDELADHDLGLSHDLPQLVANERRAWGRRGLLGLLGVDTDLVFSDGYSLQLATVTGSAEEGYTFSLNVPV